MSNLLLEWLNNEVELSTHIFQFGESFKNGYLFGEILAKYNQQTDFSQFLDKETPLAALNNFQRLEPTMKKIGVKFNSRLAAEMMKGDDKIVKTLLYEIKASLERLARNSTMSIPPKLRGTKHDRVLNVVQPSKPAYDKTVSKTFQFVVRGVLENTNEALMNEVTKRYVDREDTYTKTINTGESGDLDQLTIQRRRAKDIYKTRKAQEGEFKDVWDIMNQQQWRKNQTIAHKRKELYATIESNIEKMKNEKVSKIKNEHRDYTLTSMDQFEKKLEDMILPIGDENKDDDLKKTFIRQISLK
jgi:DNA-binding cell septation regulator SpoVG